jgi:tryptophan 2,3-dioxygenase
MSTSPGAGYRTAEPIIRAPTACPNRAWPDRDNPRAALRDHSLVTYGKYLKLDELLACQALESAKHGAPAHDELLFIVTHQTYELWFKQVLHELDAVLAIMGADVVAEKDVGRALHHLERIVKIQGVLVDQIDVLETMTPLDFLDFRNLLTPSSGFQSAQFRQLEKTDRAHPAAALQRGRLRGGARRAGP